MSISLGGINIVDILILAIIFLSVLIGLLKGFVSEVISLITLIAAFTIAILFTHALAAYFTSSDMAQDVVSQTSTVIGTSTDKPLSYVAIGISFALLFIGTMIIGAIAKMILNAIFATGILGFGNRILGAGFGFVRGLLLTLVLIFLVQLSPLASRPWWQQSSYVPYFQPQVIWLASIVSPALDNLKSTFSNVVNDAKTATAGNTNGDSTATTGE